MPLSPTSELHSVLCYTVQDKNDCMNAESLRPYMPALISLRKWPLQMKYLHPLWPACQRSTRTVVCTCSAEELGHLVAQRPSRQEASSASGNPVSDRSSLLPDRRGWKGNTEHANLRRTVQTHGPPLPSHCPRRTAPFLFYWDSEGKGNLES